jgi:hypothetical protein
MREEFEVLEYQGFVGSAEFDEYEELWYGHVCNSPDPIRYEGLTFQQMRGDFESAVDEYLNELNVR